MTSCKSQQEKNERAEKKRSSYYPGIVNRPRILKREKTQLDSEHLRGYLEVLNEENGYKTAYNQEKKSFYVFHRLFEKRFRQTSAIRQAVLYCRISVFGENTSQIKLPHTYCKAKIDME